MSGRHRWFLLVVIAGTAAFVYRAGVRAYFFDDDFQWLAGSLSFSWAQLVDVAEMRHFFRPVIDLYFVAATPLFGGSPALFHAANVALHIVNGLLVFAVARELSASTACAFLSALFFVVQPADVDTIAWVSALAEAISTAFGCLTLLWFLRFRRSGAVMWLAWSTSTFLIALLTHESSVMFMPIIVLADRMFHARGTKARAAYLPFVALLCAYLLVDLRINSRNYIVTEGHYGVGWHVIRNARDYLVAMYVGKGNRANYVLIVAVLVATIARGSRLARFSVCWMLLALVPFVFFTWGTATRYVYLSAIGFSMLLAEGVVQLDRLLALIVPRMTRLVMIGLIAAAVATRFMVFAAANVRSFAGRTEAYRAYAARVRETHGTLPPYSRVAVDFREVQLPQAFVRALIQWEYRDPTIEVVAAPTN